MKLQEDPSYGSRETARKLLFLQVNGPKLITDRKLNVQAWRVRGMTFEENPSYRITDTAEKVLSSSCNEPLVINQSQPKLLRL
jgi:hypothetical protein